MTAELADTPRTALAVRGLSKAFAETRALRDFALELRVGEVHALVGGNGCGKSTLIKTLAGVHQADSGELEIRGEPVPLAAYGPADAKGHGLRFVHQDLGIFPILSIAENLAIGVGFPTGLGGRIQWRRCLADAAVTLKRFHVDVDPSLPAEDLSTPQRAMLAIARALQTIEPEDRAVLVLDEPTASLPPEEAQLLLDSIRRLAGEGHTVLLVTHRIDEVRRVADRVTGMRDGRNVETVDVANMSEADAVELILGRRLKQMTKAAAPKGNSARKALTVRGLTGGPLHGLDLELDEGEIFGIAGTLGSGRTELLEMIFGARPFDTGEVRVGDTLVGSPRPGNMRRHGVAFVPENRQAEGVFPDHDVAENMTAGGLGRYFKSGRLRDGIIRREVSSDIGIFHVKASSPRAKIETLSGGNQQKVVLARWLRTKPRVMLLDEPTQGIDVGARDEIFSLVSDAAARGAGVIVVSSEFEELSRLCHRVAVLSGGRIVETFPTGADTHTILQSVIEHAGRL